MSQIIHLGCKGLDDQSLSRSEPCFIVRSISEIDLSLVPPEEQDEWEDDRAIGPDNINIYEIGLSKIATFRKLT